MLKKRLVILVALSTLFIVAFGFSQSFLLNSLSREQKIAYCLYNDQTIQAIKELKTLLFFHPGNLYGIRIKELIDFPDTSEIKLNISKSPTNSKISNLSDQEMNLIQSPLRKFCLGGENLLLHTLLGSGKLTEKMDPIIYFGTMKWALRKSAWQNYCQSKERLISTEKKMIQSSKQDQLDILFFSNLFSTLSDKSLEESLWKTLYQILEPQLLKNPITFTSQFSETLYQTIISSGIFNQLNATFSISTQSFITIPDPSTDLPMFRLNQKRTGKSSFTGPKTASLVWRKKLEGWIVSSPVVLSDQSILIACFDGNLYHLSPSGEIFWKFYAGSWIVSTPAVNEMGTIYFGNQDGFLFSLEPDGKLNWKLNLSAMIGSSPVVSPTGDVLIGCFDGSMVCVKPEGETRWKFTTGSWILSSPAFLDNNNIVFGSTDQYVYCLKSSGDLVWKFKTSNMVVGSPAIDDNGRILIGSLDSTLYCLQSNGSMIWKYAASSWIISSPAIGANNQIYFAEKKGIVICLDESGKRLWKYVVDGVIEGSPLLDNNDVLYISSWNRNLYAIGNGQLLWKYIMESESRSTPALSKGGTLYIGAEDCYLYAFQNKP